MEIKTAREPDIPEEAIKKLQELKVRFNSFGDEEREKFMGFLRQDSSPISSLKIEENSAVTLLGEKGDQ